MVEEGFMAEDFEKLPLGIALPLVEALALCRDSAPTGWPAAAYSLIGREDMAAVQDMSDGNRSLGRAVPGVSGSLAASAPKAKVNRRKEAADDSTETSLADGLDLVEELSSELFWRDLRVHEACRILKSCTPSLVTCRRLPEVSDHEYMVQQQAKLLSLCTRKLATTVGRGIMTLGTTVPLLADPLDVPTLCLAGRVNPTNVILKLDVSGSNFPRDYTVWPEFHNGVAAGLRLSSSVREGGEISRTWIIYNRPKEGASHSHAGLLLAFGLQGHLSALATTDILDYLTKGKDTVTVGVLLGMAAAKRGTSDTSCAKMLSLYLPSLLPPAFGDIEVSSVIQMAGIAGLGLVYQGTCNRLMTEHMLNEIGKPPGAANITDRQGYSLAAGLSLGFINLGRGGEPGLSDLKIEEKLQLYVAGGKDPLYDKRQQNSQEASDALGAKTNLLSGGVYINTDSTSAGAILALGLMFIRSNNVSVAGRLALPDTHFLLDYVRPDFLLLRVVARALILWDSVHPTMQWVQDQVPQVIQYEFDRLGQPLPEEMVGVVDRQTIRQGHCSILAGGAFALGLRYAGTGDKSAAGAALTVLRHLKALRECGVERKSCKKLANQRPEKAILEPCVCATALGLAMIMAGTGDLESFKVLRELRWRLEHVTYGTHMAFGIAIGLLFCGGGRATLGRSNGCIAALVAAFFPRFPSSVAENDMFPASTSDNEYHLQALRHLYVLAIENRYLEAIDVDTKESTYAPLTITLKDGKQVLAVTPCMLPSFDDVTMLQVNSSRYFQVTVDPGHKIKAVLDMQRIYVKRKAGHISYKQDPTSLDALYRMHGGAEVNADAVKRRGRRSSSSDEGLTPLQVFRNQTDSDEAKSEDPHLLLFARCFCSDSNSRREGKAQAPLLLLEGLAGEEEGRDAGKLARFCSGALWQCLTEDNPQALSHFLSLYLEVLRLYPSSACDRKELPWSLDLFLRYCRGSGLSTKLEGGLVVRELAESVVAQLLILGKRGRPLGVEVAELAHCDVGRRKELLKLMLQ
ncbi:unnamed protein product [Chrysoparadoxa australica]